MSKEQNAPANPNPVRTPSHPKPGEKRDRQDETGEKA